MRKKLYYLSFIVMTSIALVACGDEKKTSRDEKLDDVVVEESSEEIEKTSEELTETSQEITELDEAENEFPEAYKNILDKTYELLTTDTSDYTWQDGEMCIAEIKNGDDIEATLSNVGYCLLDLDDNGIDELVICEASGDEPSRILALYTLRDQEPTLLVEGLVRDRYYILNDNKIYNEGSGGAAYTIFGTYHISQDGKTLEVENCIFSDYEDVNDMNSWGWFKSTQAYGDPSNSEKLIFEDENEPYNMMEAYLADCKKLDLILFSDYSK